VVTAFGYRVEVRERTHGDAVQKARFRTLDEAREYQRLCGSGEGYIVVLILEGDDGWDVIIPQGWTEADDDSFA
jgi:hypothetical protein